MGETWVQQCSTHEKWRALAMVSTNARQSPEEWQIAAPCTSAACIVITQRQKSDMVTSVLWCGVFYSCLGRREGAYNPCPKWARIYRLMTESGSKAFPASRAPEV